ncbi:MAG: rRNA pseudouridine synthase [Calditrichaeota bacterium]|nr:rRNA pseudouridine synthase [Calditrichota bacterium]
MKKRLNKFLSECGVASRRKCDVLIQTGRVTVNNEATVAGVIVDDEKDEIRVDGKRIHLRERKRYILLHKPRGVVTTVSDERGRKTVLDLIPDVGRLFPVGRLDRDSSGALILTNDGELAYGLTHPKFGIEKVYHALLVKPISAANVKKVAAGIMLEDGIAAPAGFRVLNRERTKVELILVEGRNREVRRIFEAVGNRVRRLKRFQFASLKVNKLRPGEYRFLTKNEIKELKNLIDEQR